MSFLDAIFGSSPSAEVTKQTTLTGNQRAKLRELLRGLELPKGIKQAVVPFGGELSAGPSNLENLSLQALEQQAMNLVTPPEGGGVQGQASDTLSQLLSGQPTDFDAFFRDAIESPLLRTFSEDIVPQLQARGAKNFFSTGQENVETRAAKNLTQQLTGARSELGFKTAEAAKDRQLAALGMVDTVTGMPIRQAMQLLEAGRVPREIEQAGLTREYAEFLRQQEARNTRINQILAAIGLPAMENIATVSGGSSGLLSGFLGTEAGAGALVGLGTSLFSSSRELKEDISPADEDEILDGLSLLPINRWKYIGDPIEHLGPMAEDFQETFGVGDGATIHLADVAGVLLASNKALAKKIDVLSEK
jgi:hypothetical protein